MSETTTTGRIRKGAAWVDAPIPSAIADVVSALNRAHCDVAGVTENTITLVDGRVLHVRRRAIADLVHALNKGWCEVVDVTEDTITLADGRALHVRFNWRIRTGS